MKWFHLMSNLGGFFLRDLYRGREGPKNRVWSLGLSGKAALLDRTSIHFGWRRSFGTHSYNEFLRVTRCGPWDAVERTGYSVLLAGETASASAPFCR